MAYGYKIVNEFSEYKVTRPAEGNNNLRGVSTHILLEWAAVCVALFTVCLTIRQCVNGRNIGAALFGIIILITGALDFVHTLIADSLVEAAPGNRHLTN